MELTLNVKLTANELKNIKATIEGMYETIGAMVPAKFAGKFTKAKLKLDFAMASDISLEVETKYSFSNLMYQLNITDKAVLSVKIGIGENVLAAHLTLFSEVLKTISPVLAATLTMVGNGIGTDLANSIKAVKALDSNVTLNNKKLDIIPHV